MASAGESTSDETPSPIAPAIAAICPLALPRGVAVLPLGRPPAVVRDWFDHAAAALIPDDDGTLATARAAAGAYAGRAKAGNTRRAYRAGVRAWCDWCDRHHLPCLPGHAADVAAFLAAGRGHGLSVNTLTLRRAAIRYLHVVAGCPVPTAEAAVGETMAGITRHAAETGQVPARKLAATAAILRQILQPIEPGLAGLRDRALLLTGFAGALRRAELAAIRVEHLEPCDRGLRLTLPLSKGERGGRGVTVAIPYGTTELCPVRALRQWQSAAGITEGPVFRRIWTPPRGRTGQNTPLPRVGYAAIDAGTVARIVQARAAKVGSSRTPWAVTASSAAH
jgi:integrase